MKFWNKVTPGLLVMGLASPLLMNCDALGGLGVPGAGCPALDSGKFDTVKVEGGADVKAKLTGFMEATFNFNKLVVDMETNLIASCKELGLAVGMSEEELAAEPAEGEGAKTVCAAVSAKVKGLYAKAEGKITITIGEPKCYVDVDAFTSCLGECGSPIDPGKLEASCQGGEISGTCEGKCEGSCVIEAGAECKGSCGGECTGKCDGKTSEGAECKGTCEGTCSSTCEVKGQADCKARCSGGCDGEIKAPKCDGTFTPPSVDPSCQINCGAQAAAKLSCDPPSVIIAIEGDVDENITGLVKGLRAALPNIVKIQLGTAVALKGSAQGLVQGAADLKDVVVSGGIEAIGCAASAGSMAGKAAGSISVNIEASASVSGSVSGGT